MESNLDNKDASIHVNKFIEKMFMGAKKDKKCKADTEEKGDTKFCQYCADNGKKDVAHTHWQSNCNNLKNDLKAAKGRQQ